MSKPRPFILALWAASLAAVAWLSLAPASDVPPLFPHIDKLGHFVAYAWLALLPMRGFATRDAAFRAVGAVIFYGAGLEVAQAFVPTRDPSFPDLLADLAGTGLGAWLGVRMKMRDWLKASGMDRHYRTDGSRR